jgi:hypothetical protein
MGRALSETTLVLVGGSSPSRKRQRPHSHENVIERQIEQIINPLSSAPSENVIIHMTITWTPASASHMQRLSRSHWNELFKLRHRINTSTTLDAILMVDRRGSISAGLECHGWKTVYRVATSVGGVENNGDERLDPVDSGDPLLHERLLLRESPTWHCRVASYVAPILVRLPRVTLLVDLDRTIVDNSIEDTSCRHAEVHWMDCYPPSRCCKWHRSFPCHHATPHSVARREVIYVRPRILELLADYKRKFGFDCALVTKSTTARAKAILDQLIDPSHDLFGNSVFAAEDVVDAALQLGETAGACPVDHQQSCTSWFQKQLLDARKSIRSVLDALYPGTERKAESAVVIDDQPHVWFEDDWNQTVAVEPFLLRHRDDDTYLSPDGPIAVEIASRLLRYFQQSAVEPSQAPHEGSHAPHDGEGSDPTHTPIEKAWDLAGNASNDHVHTHLTVEEAGDEEMTGSDWNHKSSDDSVEDVVPL